MSAKFEIRKKVAGSFQSSGDANNNIVLLRSHWDIIEGKPSTYTPTAHSHNEMVYYVEGNTTGTAGTWTGTISGLSAYYDGLTIRFRIGIAGASTTTLNINSLGAVTVQRYVGSSNITTHFPVNAVITITKVGSSWVVQDWYDSTDDYGMRWINSVIAGAEVTQYKIVMEAMDGKFYPLSIGNTTANTKTVATTEFKIDGLILQYGYTGTIALNGAISSYGLWSHRYVDGQVHYTLNQSTGFTAYYSVFLKGTIQTNGTFRLDNTSLTSWFTQTLPTTDDGFVYIRLGYMHNTTTAFTLTSDHPMYHYKNGALRLFIPAHLHGNITNDGKIGETSDQVVVTTTGGTLTTQTRSGIDSRSTFPPSSHTHAATDVNSGTLPVIYGGTGASAHTSGEVLIGAGANAITSLSRSGIDTRSTFPPTIGSTASTAVAGNDSRLTDARTPLSHTHGNISNAGAIGTTTDLPIKTSTSGLLVAGAWGTSAGTFCQGNDSRLSDSRTPIAHTHGNITNAGAIGSTADLAVVTTTSGVLITQSRSGIDSRSTFPPSTHSHAAADTTSGTFDTARIPNLDSAKITSGTLDAARIPNLDASKITTGTIDVARLPAIAITDVFTAANQTIQVGISPVQKGDICVRSDENKTYIHNGGTAGTMADWTLLATPTDVVLSVAGKTGAVTLAAGDVGLGNVTNESKATMFASPTFTGTVSGVTKTHVGLGNVPNTDATNPANIAWTASYRTVTDTEKSTWNGKENAITAGTTSQWWRGDKTWQTISAGTIGAAADTHAHGNISSTGVLAATSSPVVTDGLGAITTTTYSTFKSSLALTKSDVALGNLTNDTQVKKRASSTSGAVPTWNGTTGDALNDGYAVLNSASPAALGTAASLVTEQDVYYGLVAVNNAAQSRATTIYAPTAAGTARQVLISAGGTSAPTWETNPLVYTVSSDLTYSILTFVDVTGLTTVSLPVGTYKIELIGSYRGAAVTTGIKLGAYLSAGAANVRGLWTGQINATTGATDLTQSFYAIGSSNLAGSNILTTGVSSTTIDHFIGFTAILRVTTAAVLRIEGASEANGSGATIKAGTTLIVTRLS